MQYVGRAIGSVSKTWNSLNPSTLSGAIDVVVVERPDGELHCSAFHVRFGKLSLLQPSQKGVDFYVNGRKVDVPMKLGEGGEAFFVVETHADVPQDYLTSPVVSPANSPGASPKANSDGMHSDDEVEFLDINDGEPEPKLRKQNLHKLDEMVQRLSEVDISPAAKNNGDVIMDMTGYKPDEANTRVLEEVVDDIFDHDAVSPEDSEGNNSSYITDRTGCQTPPEVFAYQEPRTPNSMRAQTRRHFVKTLRLTSETLRRLDLKPGENQMKFVVRSNKATVSAQLYLWDNNTPVVVSDIDGTITRSDALGHVMTMIGRDWTHAGVGKLFGDIASNGYNVMYLTSRSAGLADVTRGYLRSIDQDGCQLPSGPVILSPDRTMAALRREVIMRKPEIFKMACLRDISKLYDLRETTGTPFFAGFGNRITDAISYRSVGIPSTKIFTINTNSEVHMELLELTGYKSTYMNISTLVDHLFPPLLNGNNRAQRVDTIDFTDTNFWREPLPELSDESDDSDDSRSESLSPAPDFSENLSVRFGEQEFSSQDSASDYEPDSDSDSGNEDEDEDDGENDDKSGGSENRHISKH